MPALLPPVIGQDESLKVSVEEVELSKTVPVRIREALAGLLELDYAVDLGGQGAK